MPMVYKPTNTGLRGLLRSREVQDHCVERAEVGANYVRARAPRRTGDYIAGIGVERGQSAKGDRTAAFLVAEDDASAPLEFGNQHTEAHGLLRSAIPIIEGRGS